MENVIIFPTFIIYLPLPYTGMHVYNRTYGGGKVAPVSALRDSKKPSMLLYPPYMYYNLLKTLVISFVQYIYTGWHGSNNSLDFCNIYSFSAMSLLK